MAKDHARETGAGGVVPQAGTAWGAACASAVIDRDVQARQQREDVDARAARLQARVERDGIVWFQRVEADVRAAADAFNARIGRPVVVVETSVSGRIVVSARTIHGAGHVAILLLLSTDETAPAPGAIVTEARHGREQRIPFDFVLDNDELKMRRTGEVMSPEAFGRVVLERWLAALPLGGR